MVRRHLTFQEKPHQEEIDRHANGEHRYRGEALGDAQADEKRERCHLQQIIDHVAQGKPGTASGVGLHPESVFGAGKEVEDEAHDVACGVGNGCAGAVQQQQIDAILDECCQCADYAEAHDFAPFSRLLLI